MAKTPQADLSDEAVKNRLFSKAMITLRERHKEEFVEIVSALYAEHGLTYKPRLTPEERARKRIQEIAAEAGISVSLD